MAKKKDKIQEIIDKSGNDLQFQVAEYLAGHKWEVSRSPYYNDPATSKAREIDYERSETNNANQLGNMENVNSKCPTCKHGHQMKLTYDTTKGNIWASERCICDCGCGCESPTIPEVDVSQIDGK